MVKQSIEDWDNNTGYFETDDNLSSFNKLKELKQHLNDNGFIL